MVDGRVGLIFNSQKCTHLSTHLVETSDHDKAWFHNVWVWSVEHFIEVAFNVGRNTDFKIYYRCGYLHTQKRITQKLLILFWKKL